MLISLNSYCAMWASVKVPKAIIYADKQMSSPIGYFKKGTKIRVGSKTHSNGTMFATTYQRKVVFIRVADTRSSRDEKLTSSASERIESADIKVPLDQMMGFSLASTNLTLSQGTNSLDKSAQSSFGNFSIDYYKKFTGNHIDIKLAANWNNFYESKSNIKMIDLSFDYVNYILNKTNYRVAALLGFNAIPYINRNFDGEFDSSGYGLGANLGIELHSAPFKKAIFILGFNYKYLYTLGFKTPSEAKDLNLDIDSNMSLMGHSLYTGVVFKY